MLDDLLLPCMDGMQLVYEAAWMLVHVVCLELARSTDEIPIFKGAMAQES